MALMPFTDPNASAAANAGQGLNRLANFLYEQQVTKPAQQAQTAETQTQTQAIQGQITAQQLQNKQALFEQLSNHPIINPDAINAAANGTSQATDISTAPNASQVNTTAPVTGAAGDGYSGPAPASASITQLPNTPAGGTPNQAGSSRQGPDTIASKLPPVSDDDLAPSLTKPGRSVFGVSSPAGTPGQPGASATPPVTSSVSPSPSVTSPAASAVPNGGFDFRKELGTPFSALPPTAQTELLKQMRQPFVKAGLPVTDQELIGHYQNAQSQMIPPPMMRAGFVPTTLQDGKVNGVFTGGLDALNNGGGNQGGSARIFDPTLGHFVDNPAYTKPAEVASTQSDLAALDQADTMTAQAKAAITANPSVVGPISGSAVGNATRWVEGAVGSGEHRAQARDVQQFLSKQFLTTLQDLHVGRVLEKEYTAVMDGMPTQTDSAQTWNKFFSTRLEPFLSKVRGSKQQELNAQTGQPQASLPPVSVGPNVATPTASPSGGIQTFTPEQVKALPKGYGSFRGTNGKIYSK